MAENSLNRVFIKPADKHKDETKVEEKYFDRSLVIKMLAGMNSGDFEQAVKAYALFDRISKKKFWEGERA